MKTKVLIIGGGIAGLSLGLLLSQKGLETILVEKGAFREPVKHNGRTAALMGGSIDLLKEAGVWNNVSGIASPLETMRIIDDSDSKIEVTQVDFKAAEIGLDCFGHNIPNDRLRYLLFKAAKEAPSLTILECKSLKSFDTARGGAVNAVFDDGLEISTELLVGAEGRMSKVRSHAHVGVHEHDYGQDAITCLIEHSKPHQQISTEHHRPGGPFTMVPMLDTLDGRHLSSLVWVEKTDDAKRFMTLSRPAFEEAIQLRTRDSLGKIRLESSPESWPLKGMSAKSLIADRVALIAEAAHALSPIGAQGLNLSLRDVAGLRDVLLESARLGCDLGAKSTLQQYEKIRSLDVNTRFHGVNLYSEIVSNNIGALRGLRRFGFGAVNAIPPLKEFIMRQGLNS